MMCILNMYVHVLKYLTDRKREREVISECTGCLLDNTITCTAL